MRPSSPYALGGHTLLTALLGTVVQVCAPFTPLLGTAAFISKRLTFLPSCCSSLPTQCMKHLASLLCLQETLYWLLSPRGRKVPAGLPAVESLEQVSERCHRVLGLNPGPHTLHGTNTYLIGAGTELILVDTGEASTSAAWLAAVLSVLQRRGGRIVHVLLTHGHFDHQGGVCALLAEMARLGMPLPAVHKRRITASGDGRGAECGDYPARGFPCLHLQDGQQFHCSAEGGQVSACACVCEGRICVSRMCCVLRPVSCVPCPLG